MEVTGGKSENIVVLFCESCEVENSKTSANGVCQECKEYMCATCFRHHLKSKRTRHHVLLSLEELSSLKLDCGSEDVIKCNKHDDEIIKFHCRSHDVVGCGDCMVLEHTSCKPEYIKDLAKSFTDGDVYKSIVKRVEDLGKKKSDCKQDIEKDKEKIGKMNEKALKEIREFRKEINTCLDEAEANILSELKKMTMENTGQLEKIVKGIQSLTSDLQTMTQMLNTQLHHGNALFINAVNCKSKLADMETMYENITKEMALKEFEFVRNKHISELLKAAEPLGSLKFFQIERGIKQCVVGARVHRGPGWKYENQDGEGSGTLIGFTMVDWARVKWDNGYANAYHVGKQGPYDIEFIYYHYPIKHTRKLYNQNQRQK